MSTIVTPIVIKGKVKINVKQTRTGKQGDAEPLCRPKILQTGVEKCRTSNTTISSN